MFADPQVVTVNAVAQSLARISSGDGSGAFQKDDASYRMSIANQYGKRTRRTIRLDNKKIAVDPLVPTQNVPYSMGVYLVVDSPIVGYSNTELKQVIDGFLAYLTASSGAKVTQLLGGEA